MAIDVSEVIATGEISITGRLVDASNATLFGQATLNNETVNVIYKPIAGERPLWDFPDGTLAGREVSAFRFSEFAGFHLVPLTILRDGPYGLGAVQEWIDVDESVDLIDLAQSQDERLRKFVLFDAMVNNTDRKIGHLLPRSDGRLFGCDHGVCFHEEDKLRTVLWQWMGEPLDDNEIGLVKYIVAHFDSFSREVSEFLSNRELHATLQRATTLLAEGAFPFPAEDWPAVPWPPI
ncbi:MAG: SCO1664 family protein [Actinobacteria bacterium]|nr:SCO1664 family protein [Actinomycetota bacterium]